MKKTTLASMVSSALLLTACGGSGDGIVGSGAANYSLLGNVPGTTIEAYCDDGSIHTVDSDSSAGAAEHPFSLDTLPVNTPCRVVVITHPQGVAPTNANKVVTPVEFMDANGKVSLAVTSAGGDIDLGNELMDVNLSRADLDGDGIADVIDTKQVVALNDNDAIVVEKGTDPLDKDGDGIVNAYEDDDNDGELNHDDRDDDGNGIEDSKERHTNNDLDGDGVPNGKDIDLDNDGIRNSIDDDDDNDGVLDRDDDDDDNDGVNDIDDDDHRNGYGDDDDRNDRDNDDDHNDDDHNDRDNDDDHNDRDNDDDHNDRDNDDDRNDRDNDDDDRNDRDNDDRN